jgi:hypothetical protein
MPEDDKKCCGDQCTCGSKCECKATDCKCDSCAESRAKA